MESKSGIPSRCSMSSSEIGPAFSTKDSTHDEVPQASFSSACLQHLVNPPCSTSPASLQAVTAVCFPLLMTVEVAVEYFTPLCSSPMRDRMVVVVFGFSEHLESLFFLCFPLFFLSFISTVGRCFGQWGCKKISSLGTRTGGEGWPGREWYPPSCFVFI